MVDLAQPARATGMVPTWMWLLDLGADRPRDRISGDFRAFALWGTRLLRVYGHAMISPPGWFLFETMTEARTWPTQQTALRVALSVPTGGKEPIIVRHDGQVIFPLAVSEFPGGGAQAAAHFLVDRWERSLLQAVEEATRR